MTSIDFIQALALLEKFATDHDSDTPGEIEPCSQPVGINMFRRGSLDVPEICLLPENKTVTRSRRQVVHWADETMNSLETPGGVPTTTAEQREITLTNAKKPRSILKKKM